MRKISGKVPEKFRKQKFFVCQSTSKMDTNDIELFKKLLLAVIVRAKGTAFLPASLSESEADTLADEIHLQTGRPVSGKTLRNYLRQVTTTVSPHDQFRPSL